VICLLSQEHTGPAIVSVCPNATLPNMHPATIAHVKIFTFMPPFNSQRQRDCKLLLDQSLRKRSLAAHAAADASAERLGFASHGAAYATMIRVDMNDKAKTIIYVHGIGNKPPEDVLKCQWDRALFGFELGERSRLAYWVNRIFYPNPSPVTCQSGDKTRVGEQSADVQIRGVGPEDARKALQAEVDALAGTRTEKQFLQRLSERLLESQEIDDLQRIKAANVQEKVLPLPGFLRRWITERVTRALLRDVHEFFFVSERRDAMRKSVLDRLMVGGGPFVVIGHSQGSMIAYDVLCDVDPKNIRVPQFITIGSPLGLTEVQDQLKKFRKEKQLRVPACVENWLNVADPLDPVCLDKSLGGEFGGRGTITDEIRWNKDSPRDPHSGTGYLSLSLVQSAVQQCVDISLFQPVAAFVIARDLSRDLERQGQQRHQVLVEIDSPSDDDWTAAEVHRENLIKWLLKQTKQNEEILGIERLRRYVAASLTRSETELLASTFSEHGLKINHVWKNAEKRVLINRSVDTVQARPAHLGYGAQGQDICWAVLDSGINVHHPHFKKHANIRQQFDCTPRGPLQHGRAADGNGHGTHVAGIIAGEFTVGKPQTTFTGMAPAAKLFIYKVLDDAGNGNDAWIVKALDHIASMNESVGEARVHGVNLSLGGGFDPSVFGCGHTPLCTELRRLWNQGVLVVIAAGNEGFAVLQGTHGEIDANMDLSIGDPANLDEAIAVGSVNKTNPHTYGISYFSSRGPTADGRQKPDVVAPGERILSCRHDFDSKGKAMADFYVEMSGTSMAAPHVSGLLASYLSSRREFIGYPAKIKQILLENCTDLRRDPMHQGAGLPNLVKMLMNT
jgi:subtilisin family serine protease